MLRMLIQTNGGDFANRTASQVAFNCFQGLKDFRLVVRLATGESGTKGSIE